MAEEVRISKTTATALIALVLIGAFVGIFWEDIKQWFGNWTSAQRPITQEKVREIIREKTIVEKETTKTETGEEETPLPSYQLSSVGLYVMDAIDTDSPISGETVYVYQVGVNPADPDASPVDSATTDANGLATFDSGRIFVGKDYQYVLKGTNVYDVIETRKVPVPSKEFAVTSWTFEDAMYAYKVGSFKNLGSDLTINITTDTGLRHYEFDITLGEAEAGKVIKQPVLMLRTPEGKELATGCVRSIYFVHKSGGNLGLPLGDVKDRIDGAPITLNGQVISGFLTVNDEETVTVKLDVDNSICTAGSALEIALDDLGGYRERDVASLKLGADTEKVTISFVA